MSTDVHEEAVAPLRAAHAHLSARSARVNLIVGLSAAAGVIHVKALFEHATHWWAFGVFFGVLAYGQILWAAHVYRRPDDRRLWRTVALASLGVVAIWVASRTVGLPVGPWAGEAEPAGVADVAATVDELALVALVFAELRPDRRLAARLAWLDASNCLRIGLMLAVMSLLAVIMGSHSHPAVR